MDCCVQGHSALLVGTGAGMHSMLVQELANVERWVNLTVPVSFRMRVGGVECYYWSCSRVDCDCPRCKDGKTNVDAVSLKRATWGGKISVNKEI